MRLDVVLGPTDLDVDITGPGIGQNVGLVLVWVL